METGPEAVDLEGVGRVVVLGFGKAVSEMGSALVDILAGHPVEGVLVSPTPAQVERLRVVVGSHPIPDQQSVKAGRLLLETARSIGSGDLVVILISGGGSALVTVPAGSLTLEDLQSTNDLLLRSGATIAELNTVRKHLSGVKGGRLAEAVSASRAVVTLVISDVVGGALDVIASGPTVPDPTTYSDALDVMERYGLRDRVPARVSEHLERGLAGVIPETPKSGEVFEKQIIRVIADGSMAAQAARDHLDELAGEARIVTVEMRGEARLVAAEIAEQAVRLATGESLVYAGETTVSVRGSGRGGRNQELALATALEIAGREDLTVLCMGTDGIDGNSPAAGAVIDGTTVIRAESKGLDAREHLDDNDSYTYLSAIGDTIECGPTGTNVGDLVLIHRTC